MRLHTVDTPADVALVAGGIVAEFIRRAPGSALGLATGGSVIGLYAELRRAVQAGEISCGDLRAFLLDEYVGLPAAHPQSYRRFIREHLSDHVDLDERRVFGLDGIAPDADVEALRYERLVVAANVGLQIVGIGGNGHLAFNEPGSSLDSVTRVVTLSEVTRRANARFFAVDEEVPSLVLTQGVGTIMRAETIVLVAFGENKAAAVASALRGPVTSDVPASALQQHPDVIVVIDRAAAARLGDDGRASLVRQASAGSDRTTARW
jgi:glucosamine-6-phosphate deaminase